MSLEDILTLGDMEKEAASYLPASVMNHIQGGATYENTMNENISAFKKYKIRPRVLRDVSDRSTATTILGNKVALPVGISPSDRHKITDRNHEGEISTAKASVDLPIVMTVSMTSSVATRDIMKVHPSLICFQQLFITRPKSYTEKFVKMAEESNVKALVVTVDLPVTQIKYRSIKFKADLQRRRNGFARANNDIHPATHGTADGPSVMLPGNTTWKDITWLKGITHLPVIAKGITNVDDALEALAHGIDAIWVSNHGGRALDSLPATIDILAEIVKVVDGRCEVYVDGGFRTGLDVFKALAMGVTSVFIGRPVHYGLAVAGSDGVKHLFNILRKELDNTMALAGCKSVKDIEPNYIFDPLRQGCCKL